MKDQPKFSMWQIVRASLAASVAAIEEVRALARQPGPKGERGAAGTPGKLPLVKNWEDKIHYEGDVVTHAGGTYQANCNTAKQPGHSDWILLSAAGVDGKDGIDGRSLTIRETYDLNAKYLALDIVTLNSCWFVAKKDAPGICPGPDWKAGPQGRRGEKGERGDRGQQGATGRDGREFIGWEIDRKNFTVIPIMSDGSEAPAIELRGLFEQFQLEAM